MVIAVTSESTRQSRGVDTLIFSIFTGLHQTIHRLVSLEVHVPVPDSSTTMIGSWVILSCGILSTNSHLRDCNSLFCICILLGSIVGSRLFSKKGKMDESSIIAWCGALCSQCSHYERGMCPSCPGGPLHIQETCPLLLCAREKGVPCSECEKRAHCMIYTQEREACPFGKDLFTFKAGMGYVIYEKNPHTSSQVFRDYITRGDCGLLVSRRYPEQFISRYNLEDVKAVWLSTAEGEENWIDPCNLSKLHHVICDFIRNTSPSIILFEGFEYLMVRNSFLSALKFVQSLMDEIVLSRSKLLLSINSDAFDKKELALIRRELIEIE